MTEERKFTVELTQTELIIISMALRDWRYLPVWVTSYDQGKYDKWIDIGIRKIYEDDPLKLSYKIDEVLSNTI